MFGQLLSRSVYCGYSVKPSVAQQTSLQRDRCVCVCEREREREKREERRGRENGKSNDAFIRGSLAPALQLNTLPS